MSDYLWDKSGTPDPDIRKLEELLAPLAQPPDQRFSLPRRTIWIPLAAVASVLIALAAAWFSFDRANHGRLVWQVSGNARVTRLGRGQSLHTDDGSRARLELASVGQVEMEPNSQLSVETLVSTEQRLKLKRGKISALIWAPPGQFFVDTPSAVAVDLGCAYTLEVDATGASLVKVTAGWVAFEGQGQESFIPATAASVTRPGQPPGVPYYQDASPALQMAVDRNDVARILAEARPRDALTLWHLLRRVPVDQRGAVYDRLAALVTVPQSISRSAVLAGDPQSIDHLWERLGLGDAAWWRTWKTRMR